MGAGCFRNVQRFRGELAFKAHRLVYHSTLGWRVIKKKKKKKGVLDLSSAGAEVFERGFESVEHSPVCRVWGLGFRVQGLGLRA